MRALVISDTHFGAWTGEDILRDPETVALLAPHLDVDEVIMLGDLFDLLFAPAREAFTAASGLLDLLRDRLQGKRFVFLAGNHDHHLVTRQLEEMLELGLSYPGSVRDARAPADGDAFRRFLGARLEGVQVDIRYPTYTFGDVLCTHGHYLDFYARRSGGLGGRVLAHAIWSIAVGGADQEPTVEDLEATIEILTGVLFTIAQLPNGTHAQRTAFARFQALERALRLSTAPVRRIERAAAGLTQHLSASSGPSSPARSRLASMNRGRMDMYDTAMASEMERRQRTGAPGGGEIARRAMGQVLRPRDAIQPAVAAFERVVDRLGWAHDTDKIVFAHTHQPLADVRGPSGRVRYWNTGSWIYEPDLTSHEAYVRYLENAWPGTAVLIDSDEESPRLLRLREHLNPLAATESGPPS